MKRFNPSIDRVDTMRHCNYGEYVLYSEARARIEALEWLVEVQCLLDQDLWLMVSRPLWTRAEAFIELQNSLDAAREAAGVR